MGRSDLQGDIADELFELVARDSAFFAGADFDEHANLAASVNIGRDQAVAGNFEPLGARDLIDVQSFIWVIGRMN